MKGRRTRRELLALGGTALATALAGCTGGGEDGRTGGDGGGGRGGSDSASPTPTGVPGEEYAQVIAVGPEGSLRFEPADATVSTGATVQWVWRSDYHTVTPRSQPAAASWEGTGTEVFDEGHTYEYTFDVAGTYDYDCRPHRGQGMRGTLTVE